MDYLEAIERRESTRNYLDTPISKETLSALTKEINDNNEKYGLSISFLEDGSEAFNSFGKSYGLFKGVRSLIIMKGPRSDIHLKEKLGYAGEKIILKATSLGLGTCWVGGTFEKSNSIFTVTKEEEFVCVITVGEAVPKKGFLEKTIHKMMKKKPVEKLYTADSITPDWFMAGMNAAQKAPSAKNTQKVHFQYTGGIVKASVPEDYQFDLIDLGIAKLHFELAAGGCFNMGNGSDFVVK